MEREPEAVTDPEPSERGDGLAPTPSWFWVLTVVAVGWATFYVAFNSGGFKAEIFNPQQVSWAGGGGGVAAPPDPREVGKRVFTKNCVVCHQTTGEGVPGQFPPLVGSEWVLGGEWHGDSHLVRVVLNGLQGPVQVKGATFNNAMVPWRHLGAEQIAAVLTYVRSEWGNDAPPITPAFVTTIMDETADRTEPWTQKELQAIPKQMISDAAAPAAGDAAPAEGGTGAQEPPAPAAAEGAAQPAGA